MPKLEIKQVRSGIGQQAVQRRTLEALGIKHHQDSVIQEDTPAIRGMIRRVEHLVSVSEIEDQE